MRAKIISYTLVSLFLLAMSYTPASAHCEIPCGIYEDSLRVEMIKEDVQTIEKSMSKIIEISKQDNPNYNQLVRWINNKDKHAEKIQMIVWQYFLTQRIKLKDRNKQETQKYLQELELLHQMSVFAMKCKQTTDFKYTKLLLDALDEFGSLYFHKHEHKH